MENNTNNSKNSMTKTVFCLFLLTFCIYFLSACADVPQIVYTPTPEPITTANTTPDPQIEAQTTLNTTSSNISVFLPEYNYDYPIPSTIGNTGANINNGGLCVYDGDRVYYVDQGIYSMTSDGIDIVCILDMQNVSCLNSVGEYLYFLSNHDGGIYRVKKQGDAPVEHMVITGADSLIVIDDAMYYTNNKGESSNNIVYRTPIGGTSQECLFFRANQLYPDNAYIYFDNLDDDGKLYRYDTIAHEMAKVSDDKASQINIINDQLYYISQSSGFFVVRMDRDGQNTTVVVNEPCTNLNSYNTTLIYTPVSDGYIMSYNVTSGETKTLLEYDGIEFLAIADTIVYFETMIVKGQELEVYFYNLKNDATNKHLPLKIYGYITNIDVNSMTIDIDDTKVYTEQEAMDNYAHNNQISIEEARKKIYNEIGTYYIYNKNDVSITYEYSDWIKVMQRRKLSSLNSNTPYVSSILDIYNMYNSNPTLSDKLVYEIVILDDQVLSIDELYYPVDFYKQGE